MADKSKKTGRVTKKQPQPAPHVKAAYDRKTLEAAVVTRALEDEAFRKALVKDAKAALEKLGFAFPKGFKLRVVEEKANEYVLALPVKPGKGGELTDDQLEAVAGGTIEDFKEFLRHPLGPGPLPSLGITPGPTLPDGPSGGSFAI